MKRIPAQGRDDEFTHTQSRRPGRSVAAIRGLFQLSGETYSAAAFFLPRFSTSFRNLPV